MLKVKSAGAEVFMGEDEDQGYDEEDDEEKGEFPTLSSSLEV
jgi:hypothetical protein